MRHLHKYILRVNSLDPTVLSSFTILPFTLQTKLLVQQSQWTNDTARLIQCTLSTIIAIQRSPLLFQRRLSIVSRRDAECTLDNGVRFTQSKNILDTTNTEIIYRSAKSSDLEVLHYQVRNLSTTTKWGLN